MKSANRDATDILLHIFRDRTRTNLFRSLEQKALSFLVQVIPAWMTSDMLTFIGSLGSLTVLVGFVLATYFSKYFLLLGILGLTINWFGDSLDGRLAYYRNRPRKWYGFSLDLLSDWISVILIGLGYIIYSDGLWDLAGFGFVVLYGWAMIIAIIRYLVTGKYTIDAGLVGPTEIRVIISIIIILEVLLKGTIYYSAIIVSAVLFIINICDTLNLFRQSHERDKAESEKKQGTK